MNLFFWFPQKNSQDKVLYQQQCFSILVKISDKSHLLIWNLLEMAEIFFNSPFFTIHLVKGFILFFD